VDVFQAVADPVRRRLVDRLANGECPAGELVRLAGDEFGISQPAVSKHLRVLREAGLVTSSVAAQRRVYRLEPTGLTEIHEWTTRRLRLWHDRPGRLERHRTAHPPRERT
jgi:DNA-binding transcriptional ArsR family regulator